MAVKRIPGTLHMPVSRPYCARKDLEPGPKCLTGVIHGNWLTEDKELNAAVSLKNAKEPKKV